MALDFIGGMILIAVVVVTISVFTEASTFRTRRAMRSQRSPEAGPACSSRSTRLARYQAHSCRRFPLVGVMVAAAADRRGIAAVISQRVRATLLAVPMPLLIGLNAMRDVRRILPAARRAGRLDGPFPYLGRLGRRHRRRCWRCRSRIAVARGSASPATDPGAGTCSPPLDLVAAITLGTLSSNGSLAGRSSPATRLGRRAAHALAADPDRAGAVLPHHARHHLRAAPAAVGNVPKLQPDIRTTGRRTLRRPASLPAVKSHAIQHDNLPARIDLPLQLDAPPRRGDLQAAASPSLPQADGAGCTKPLTGPRSLR